MNWSATPVALVPLGVETVMSTVPVPDGSVAVRELPAVLTTTAVAETAPKRTRVAPESPLPVRVTDVPPVEGPDDGLTVVTTGGGPDAAAGAAAESPTADTVATTDNVTARSSRLARMHSMDSVTIAVPLDPPIGPLPDTTLLRADALGQGQ